MYDNDGNHVDPRDVLGPDEPVRLSRAAQRAQWSHDYGGLRVDAYGYDREGRYYPHLDGGVLDG